MFTNCLVSVYYCLVAVYHCLVAVYYCLVQEALSDRLNTLKYW